MRPLYFASALSLVLATQASAGKPPSGGTMDPQVGYVRILPSGVREIRLAGADGTGSVALATARNRNVTLSLSPSWRHQIVYTDGPAVRLLTYEVTSTGPRALTNVPLIQFASGSPAYVDFSPDGTHVLYVDPADQTVYVHDLQSSARTAVASQANYIMDVEFTHDGSKVIYSVTVDPSLLNVQFKSVPITGGQATDLPIQGKYGAFNVGHSDDRIVVDTPGDWDTGAITLISQDGSSATRLTTGYSPVFLCGSHLLYQRRNLSAKGAVSILKQDLVSGSTTTYSSADNMWADTYPDCQ